MTKIKDSSKNTRIIIIISVVFFGLVATGYFLSNDEKRELNEFGSLSEGTIVAIDHRLSRGDYVTYEFYVKSKRYTDNQRMEGDVRIGDRFKVLYSIKNPNKSRILFDSLLKK
ncbi:MAG: hypothetical protein KF775_04505 [Cyclobacteriaceae bacterium]|nr:hypothetical protein [Cyclobacteriaceae bacterium]